MREGLWGIVDVTEIEPVDNGIVGQGSNAAVISKYIARKEKALTTIVLSILNHHILILLMIRMIKRYCAVPKEKIGEQSFVTP